jgi:hypothetical protein
VRAVHVGGHDARRVRPLDLDPAWTEAHDGDLIDRLRGHQREIVLRRRHDRSRRAPRLRGDGPDARLRRAHRDDDEDDEASSRESSDHRWLGVTMWAGEKARAAQLHSSRRAAASVLLLGS